MRVRGRGSGLPRLGVSCGPRQPFSPLPTFADTKESKKEAFPLPSPRLGPKPQANGHPLPGPARPTKSEVDLGNLLNCSDLAESQASLHSSSSSSSAGSVRGEDGGAYSEFYGDYAPLFDNPQDPDNSSLQGL